MPLGPITIDPLAQRAILIANYRDLQRMSVEQELWPGRAPTPLENIFIHQRLAEVEQLLND